MKNKIITLFLSFTLIFASVVPTFATVSKTCSGPMLFAIGDSIAAGCKSGALQNAYDAYRRMENDESKYSLYTSPVDGEQHNHWYINAVPYSFVSEFGRSINASEDSMNGAHPGLRTKDYCYILGLIGKEAYKNDGWMGENATGNELAAEKNSSDGYKYAIANADVITVELGENEISTYLSQNAEKLIEIIGGLMSKGNTTEENAVLEDMQDDAKAIETAKTEEQAKKKSLKLFEDLAKLKETSKPYIEILDFLVTSIGKAAIDLRYYWNMMMNYICQHKKDGAVVMTVGVANPFHGLEDWGSMIGQLFGGDPDADYSKLIDILILLFEPFVKDISGYYRLMADKYDYTYVPMPEMKMISTVTGEYDPYDDVYLDTEVTYMVHPNHKESDKIVKALQKAYKREMAKKGKLVVFKDVQPAVEKCKHANSEIQNVAEATYLEEGYTGDKVCTDCGAYFYKGKTVPKLAVTATSLKKLTKGTKSFKATWKTLKNVDGYQLQYSTSSKFSKNSKKTTVSGAKNASKTVKSLKSGKKYYVRVRSYLTVQDKDGNDVKVYSGWSKSKSVTAK